MSKDLSNVECPNCYTENLETGEDSDGNLFYSCRKCGDLEPKSDVV